MDSDVVILPSFAQVEDWRKRRAAVRSGSFAQTVTTFNAWIADLWELHGDGRSIADSLQRQTLMQVAFEQLESGEPVPASCWQDALTVSPGVVKLAAQCVREASGVPAFEQAVSHAVSAHGQGVLSPGENVLLQGIARYYELLSKSRLIEVGKAAELLARDAVTVFPEPLRVLVARAAPLDWRMAAFFDACPRLQVTVDEASGARGIGRMADGIDLRFGFPSGRYAQPGLVSDVVRSLLSDDGPKSTSPRDIVVACKDPLAFYKQVEESFARDGIAVCVQAQVPFLRTDFGKRFMALSRVVVGEVWAKEDLSDAVLPPYSGFDTAQVLQIDRELRSNRLAQREECLASLRAASDTFSQFEELASDPQADILLGVFEQIAFTSAGRSDAWRSEQLTAASAVRSCTRVARAADASMASCMRVLEDVQVTVSYEGACRGVAAEPGAQRRVVITTQAAAAQMGAGSCAHLVLCDLTSDDYPIADRDDSATTLFAKLGLAPTDTMLARSRRTFVALQDLPAQTLTCIRPLNDWDGNPTYPAAMLQELVDAYLEDEADRDSVDETYGIPERFLAHAVQRGEETLFANAHAAPSGTVQEVRAMMPLGSRGDMPDEASGKVVLPRRRPGGGGIADAAPSPSQVELYLECPYKWFVSRRIDIEGLDEGFGPVERGSFSHAVLQKFYQEFQDMGFAKVDDENLARAKELMRRIADREEAAQYALGPGSGRYVAADRMEQREVDSCKAQLVDYLDFEARFLPTFHPVHLEFEIGLSDGVTYAGKPFIGIVDRIDVDGRGNAVVVDYKGSVGPAHEIAGKNPSLPGKVQTRIYARAVERALGLRVVGAFYVSYGKKHGCAGAFDGSAIEAAHLPFARVDHCSCAIGDPVDGGQVDDYSKIPFADMLDRTEELVAGAVESMVQGEVQPMPASPDACTYCPVASCPRRGAR